MNDTRTFNRYGEVKAGTYNKFYQVEAVELEDGRATYEFRYGRIGTEGRVAKNGSNTVPSFDYAKQICLDQWARKSRSSGYREVTAMEALASAAEFLDERPIEGLPRIALDAPCFHAGKSEERCRQLCHKFNDKLNVIRASKRKLGYDAYIKQMEKLLKQYCAEFSRLIKTKAHGHLADNTHAHTGFRIFFSFLKDNTGCVVYGYFEGVGVM